MFNFSGIFYRIWAVCGIITIWGVVILLLEKPWLKGVKSRDCKIAIATIAFGLCSALVDASRIVFPKVSYYSGAFVSTNRDSLAAPPLPYTSQYVFWNGEGEKPVYYLDTFPKREIFPDDFEEGRQYTIYYDTLTKVIVKVEVIE